MHMIENPPVRAEARGAPTGNGAACEDGQALVTEFARAARPRVAISRKGRVG